MIEYFIYIIITAGTLLGTFLILHLYKRIRGVHVEVGIIRSQLQFYMQSLEARCDCIQDEYSSLNDKTKEYSLKVSSIQGYLIEIENSIFDIKRPRLVEARFRKGSEDLILTFNEDLHPAQVDANLFEIRLFDDPIPIDNNSDYYLIILGYVSKNRMVSGSLDS